MRTISFSEENVPRNKKAVSSWILAATEFFTVNKVIYSSVHKALAGKTKRCFQIPCELQHSLDLLVGYTKERNKLERGHSFGVWPHIESKRKWSQGA